MHFFFRERNIAVSRGGASKRSGKAETTSTEAEQTLALWGDVNEETLEDVANNGKLSHSFDFCSWNSQVVVIDIAPAFWSG